MRDNLVAYSRAGDVFHYRWAARRCLKLIYPRTEIEKIVIEGSVENEKAGEYVIDISEYSITSVGYKKIDYYQLKHTTVQQEDPFTLSDLQPTFEGFAQRYSAHKSDGTSGIPETTFTIITNRPFATSLKEGISAIADQKTAGELFQKTLEKYTKLSGDILASFCKRLSLQDGQGNYLVQKEELKDELKQLIAGPGDNTQVDSLVALVQDKVLPDANGVINREEVLKRFGITSDREMYPAPAVWEKYTNFITRKQHESLIAEISQSIYPVIVHAAGGVGKSVFCQQLVNTLPEGSLGIAYDCFGAGSYRNRSETRHRHKDGLVQIVNELAARGFCSPLLVTGYSSEEDITRKFLSCLETVVKSLQKVHAAARLFILIDAADNAEMAALEFAQSCFAHELLREKIPNGCKLILLCRTERIDLLQPQSFIKKLELLPFSKEETLNNLRRMFPGATEADGLEFHRLTAQNPRVQANALEAGYPTIRELLISLGPSVTTVEKQIESQLNIAVNKVWDSLLGELRQEAESICTGLASLPPHIPLEVLAGAANVSPAQVKSFVADIGRSLWMYDNSVQFRDEPTETWFRKSFAGTKTHFEQYIKALEPLSQKITYVASVLPQLYLQAGYYDKLILLALSDDYLPVDNPIDTRNVRVYRLQFAFKAALKEKKYYDAIKLAIRAGEEMAGSERQLDLFRGNLHLLVALQDQEKVQEIAFKRLIAGSWEGSENVYAASLLSAIPDFQGEARSYFRSAINWLKIYYRETLPKLPYHENKVQEIEILELGFAHFNLFGPGDAVDFFKWFTSKEWIFNVVRRFAARLIDDGNEKALTFFLNSCKDEIYFTIAVVFELSRVGKFPEREILDAGLMLLCSKRTRVDVTRYAFRDPLIPAVIAFAEACLYSKLDSQKINRVLRHYVHPRPNHMVSDTRFRDDREIFLKAQAIKSLLAGLSEVDMGQIAPVKANSTEKNRDNERERKKLEDTIKKMFPWYLLRARALYEKNLNLPEAIEVVGTIAKTQHADSYYRGEIFPFETRNLLAEAMVLYQHGTTTDIDILYKQFLANDQPFKLEDKLDLLRASHRCPHLSGIRQNLELSIYEIVKSDVDATVEDITERYIALAKAVLVNSRREAGVYFDEAIKSASKFGEELVKRWEATVSLANRATGIKSGIEEVAYRFIRCAELVGENVSREKHWDRGGALLASARLSPGIALAAISRWRDKDVYYVEYHHESLLRELIVSKLITPTVGWACTRLFSDHHLNEYLADCLDNEPNPLHREAMLSDTICLLQKDGTSPDYWYELKDIASKYKLNNTTLNAIVQFYQSHDNRTEISLQKDGQKDEVTARLKQWWDVIFEGIDFFTTPGLQKLLDRLHEKNQEQNAGWPISHLMEQAIARLQEKHLWDFIESLLSSDNIDHYDLRNVVESIPDDWQRKASFINGWPKIIYRIGYKFALNLVTGDSFRYFIRESKLTRGLTEQLKAGMIAGLSSGDELAGADIFFGFVSAASTLTTPTEAMALLKYSLCRFELHIDPEFGDGPWQDWLRPSEDIYTNVAGSIWSALGSPRATERWSAAHCVVKLAEFNCREVIFSLSSWLKLDKVGAFGSKKFPFYNFHARQYFLIAAARASLEYPFIFRGDSKFFFDLAISGEHILIQRFAADVVINIDKVYPGTFSIVQLLSLSNVGKSPMPLQEEEFQYTTDSYWHKENKIDTNVKFHFGWDFDRYWFEPLADVFGLPGQQVEDLAANVIVNEWRLGELNGYNKDPRVIIWDRTSHDRETWHDHGSYPKTDTLDFYLSYHSMLVVAARLVSQMPIIKTDSWEKDPWTYWLSRHSLTRIDGKWLDDARGPLPLERPLWTEEAFKETFEQELTLADFTHCLEDTGKGGEWLTVEGGWTENKNSKTESFSVSSALVSPLTADALMRALSTCDDPYNYKLPDYEDADENEIENAKFLLKGWLKQRSTSKGLDDMDPYAAEISYPPYSVGESIMKRLRLIVDNDGMFWYEAGGSKPVMLCENWSSVKREIDEEREQCGMRLKANREFLQKLSKTLSVELIIEVSIKRNVNYRYSETKYKSTKPLHKLFIFSKDGKLRTTGTHH